MMNNLRTIVFLAGKENFIYCDFCHVVDVRVTDLTMNTIATESNTIQSFRLDGRD